MNKMIRRIIIRRIDNDDNSNEDARSAEEQIIIKVVLEEKFSPPMRRLHLWGPGARNGFQKAKNTEVL